MHGLVFSTGHTQYHAYKLEVSAILTPLYIYFKHAVVALQ